VRAYRAVMSDLRASIDDVFASGDEVVLRWTARGTNDGELMGNQPTHRRVEVTGISIDRYNAEGKLVEVWDEWDNLGFMHQLGMTPQMAAQA
jgi:predicted ester cyclase